MVKGTEAMPGIDLDHVEGYRDTTVFDGDAIAGDDSYPLSLHITNELATELLTFIHQRQEVMRLLKIHPMSVLSKPMRELVQALEKLYPEVEVVSVNGDS